MAGEIQLETTTRTVHGSAAARRLRKSGQLPAVVYSSKGDTTLVQTDKHGFMMMLRHHTSESLLIDLKIDGGAPRKVLLKEVQHHVISDEPIHLDFLEISMTEKMRIHIPITVIGHAIGVTRDGGTLDELLREVEVECLPTDLVESIDIDVTDLEPGQTLLARDLVIDPKLTLLTPDDIAIVGVITASLVEDETEDGEEGDAAAEPDSSTESTEKTEGTK